MNPIVEELKHKFRSGGILIKLIYVNIAVFLLINIVELFLWLFKINTGINHVSVITYWLSVPADFTELLFKPWTIFTYMFTQESLMHLFFNMLVLYFSGNIFTGFLGEKRLLSTYILGGLSGAFLFMLFYNTFPIFSDKVEYAICMGASASVLAILVATATYLPDYVVHLLLIGPVRLKYIAIVLVAIDVISIRSSNSGGHIAHLGGALWGFIYIRQFKSGKDYSKSINRIIEKIMNLFTAKPNLKVKHKKTNTNYEYNENKYKSQQKIDAILDKISKSGYDSLSKEEKDFLFKASNN